MPQDVTLLPAVRQLWPSAPDLVKDTLRSLTFSSLASSMPSPGALMAASTPLTLQAVRITYTKGANMVSSNSLLVLPM